MSVIVKNMEMPKNCKDCPFSDHEAWCLIPGDWRERYYCPDDERSEYCPLIELPPHGRLIDADKLLEKAYWDYNEATHDYNNIKVVSEYDIADAPTVIEAEGET